MSPPARGGAGRTAPPAATEVLAGRSSHSEASLLAEKADPQLGRSDLVVRAADRLVVWGRAATDVRVAWAPALACSWRTRSIIAALILCAAHAVAGLPSPIDLGTAIEHTFHLG